MQSSGESDEQVGGEQTRANSKPTGQPAAASSPSLDAELQLIMARVKENTIGTLWQHYTSTLAGSSFPHLEFTLTPALHCIAELLTLESRQERPSAFLLSPCPWTPGCTILTAVLEWRSSASRQQGMIPNAAQQAAVLRAFDRLMPFLLRTVQAHFS
jgi:hypothetical protein